MNKLTFHQIITQILISAGIDYTSKMRETAMPHLYVWGSLPGTAFIYRAAIRCFAHSCEPSLYHPSELQSYAAFGCLMSREYHCVQIRIDCCYGHTGFRCFWGRQWPPRFWSIRPVSQRPIRWSYVRLRAPHGRRWGDSRSPISSCFPPRRWWRRWRWWPFCC